MVIDIPCACRVTVLTESDYDEEYNSKTDGHPDLPLPYGL